MTKKMSVKRGFWLVRPLPHGSNHMQDFLQDNIIAVGYPTGTDFTGMEIDEIKDVLEDYNYESGIGHLNVIVHLMNKGDIVVVPDDNKRDVYFGEVTSEYIYNSKLDNSIALLLLFNKSKMTFIIVSLKSSLFKLILLQLIRKGNRLV